MSIQSEIERISGNVADAYAAVGEKGGTLPEEQVSDNLAEAVGSIPGPYTPGDGIAFAETETGTAINVETPVQELTEAEYDALPEERKNHGLYFLPDADPSGGSAGGSPMEVYDGQEHMIGTWFGKPLYRRCFVTQSPSIASEGSVEILHVEIPVDTMADIYGSIKTGTGQWSPLPFYQSASSNCFVAYNPPTHSMYPSSLRASCSNNYTNTPISIVLEYTKTTDEAVSE